MELQEHDQSTLQSPTAEHPPEKHEEYKPAVVAKNGFEKFTTSRIYHYILRAFQLINDIILVALAGTSLSKFNEGEPRMRYTVFVGAFGLTYLLVFGFLSLVAPVLVVTGVVLLLEILLIIFHLSSFIAIVARYSGATCSFNTILNPNGPGYKRSSSGCKSAKASFAFAILGFILFSISFWTIFFNVYRRLYSRMKTNRWFTFNHTKASQGKLYLNRLGWMDFKDGWNPNFGNVDYEANHGEQQTMVNQDVENQPVGGGVGATTATGTTTQGTTDYNNRNVQATTGTTYDQPVERVRGGANITGATGTTGTPGTTATVEDRGYYTPAETSTTAGIAARAAAQAVEESHVGNVN
ncbi:hypothetical protein WICMUC_003986 [Wickerhamomyces mucosus]|uniref:MARVEL domain-containing protein n=1 Tax=Wickerhamomyces mucosus TaxID=1378264 RepID=A0A9P8PKD3_9ASCO|nr:hypothetical protein WICMUC_003986 [Wickerhamomyces mucosus]